MTWVDGLIIGVIALSALFSMVRGLVREVLSVGSWIGALLACLHFYAPVQPYVASVLPTGLGHFAIYGAMAVVFLVVLILLSIVSGILGGLVRSSPLSGLDHSLGILFGVVRGGIIIFLAYIALGMTEPSQNWPAPVANARLLPMAQEGANWLIGFLPTHYQPKIQPLPDRAPSAGNLMKQPIQGSAL